MFQDRPKGGTWGLAQAWSTNDSNLVWSTDGYTAGAYEMKVSVRQLGSPALLGMATMPFTMASAAATGATLSANPADNTVSGNTVTFTAAAGGGSGTVRVRVPGPDPGRRLGNRAGVRRQPHLGVADRGGDPGDVRGQGQRPQPGLRKPRGSHADDHLRSHGHEPRGVRCDLDAFARQSADRRGHRDVRGGGRRRERDRTSTSSRAGSRAAAGESRRRTAPTPPGCGRPRG